MEPLASVFEKDPILVSSRLMLRKITLKDADDVYAYASKEETSRYLLWSPHPSLAYTKRYLTSVIHQYKKGIFFDFAVVLKENGRMIGTCGFTSVHENNNAGEVGYVISPEYHRQGLATEAVLLLLRFAFCHLQMHRMEARFMVENTASRRLAERCGMTFEGTFRDLMFVKGRYRDIGVCGILREEFCRQFGDHPCDFLGEKEKRQALSRLF